MEAGYLMVLPENLFELINENRSYLLVGVWQEFWPLDSSESFDFSILVLLLFESPRHLSDGFPMPFGLPFGLLLTFLDFLYSEKLSFELFFGDSRLETELGFALM